MATVELTKDVLAEYMANKEAKLKLDRESRALESKLEPVKRAVSAYIDQHGGADRTCIRHGFVLHKDFEPGNPKYKDEFLKIATPAEEAAIERPLVEKITVSKAGAAAASK